MDPVSLHIPGVCCCVGRQPSVFGMYDVACHPSTVVSLTRSRERPSPGSVPSVTVTLLGAHRGWIVEGDSYESLVERYALALANLRPTPPPSDVA